MFKRFAILCLCCSFLLIACGQKGDLYLRDEPAAASPPAEAGEQRVQESPQPKQDEESQEDEDEE